MIQQSKKTKSRDNGSASPYIDDRSCTDDELQELAYKLWEQRGYPQGSPEDDWYAAQKILMSKKGSSRPSR